MLSIWLLSVQVTLVGDEAGVPAATEMAVPEVSVCEIVCIPIVEEARSLNGVAPMNTATFSVPSSVAHLALSTISPCPTSNSLVVVVPVHAVVVARENER